MPVLFHAPPARRRCSSACSPASAGASKASTVQVHSLKFTGVKAVKTGQLKSVLATAQSDKLPWGTKHYFTREQFEADLKRIAAFYKDRGYPDAKVTSFDVKLNDKQDAVDITVNIDEGQPILVEMVEYIGFDAIPPAHLSAPAHAALPLQRRRAARSRASPRPRARRRSTRSRTTAFPTRTVRLTERAGADRSLARADAHGGARHAGALRRRSRSRATPASATTSCGGS